MADIISNFPDSILCHILSFLPTREVLATSLLSKRWNVLWRSVTSFDFQLCTLVDDYDEEKEFISRRLLSVYSFLLFREMDQPLHRLCFTGFSSYSHDSIERCINTALRRSSRLEHLDLNFDNMIAFAVPSVVFSCKTLVVLKLAYITPKNISFVDLPLLKILHLKSLLLFKCEDLQRFFSGCPNVEDLEVGSCSPKRLADTAGKFQILPKLIRANIRTHLVPLEFVKNVEVLVTDWIYTEDLVFDLQNLVQLELTRLKLSMKWFEVLELLKHCPKLKALIIDIYEKNLNLFCEDEEVAVLPYPEPVPTCISLHLKTCCLKSFSGSVVELQFAEYIMQNANYLRTMEFNFHFYYYKNPKREELVRYLSSCKKISDTCILSYYKLLPYLIL